MIDTRLQCTKGHAFDTTNNYRNTKGRFVCRVCNKLRMRKANSTPAAKKYNKDRVAIWVKANRQHYRDYCIERRRKTREWLTNYKRSGCIKCGEVFPDCLDFHHRDPNNKKFNIGNDASTVSLKKVIEEVAKCDLICANCHRKLHASERVLEG